MVIFLSFQISDEVCAECYSLWTSFGKFYTCRNKNVYDNDDVNLVICPEGHLKAVEKWNKGFYVIAKMSDVPVNVAVLNFKKKEIHISEPLDTKDFDVDHIFKEINMNVEMFGAARHPEKYHPHILSTEK